MPITARDIHEKEFSHAMRGYKENEVDDFLDLCAAEVDRLSRENKALYSELDQTKRALATSGSAVTIAAPVERAESEEIRFTKVSSSEIGDILVLAQNTAEDLLSKAHSQAEKIVNAAEGRASEIVGEAAARKRDIIEVAKVLKQAEVNFRHEYKTLLEKSLANITEIRMDIDPEAEVSIVTPVEHGEASVVDRPATFGDEEPAVKAEVEAAPVEEVFVPVEKPAPFDPGILEKTSFIDQVEIDDDFEIEEID